MCQNYNKYKEKTIRSPVVLFLILFFVYGTLLSCVSAPSAILSKTREIIVPELGGEVLISAIQYAGKSLALTQGHSISIKDDTKRIAIFSIQIQNTIKNKTYRLTPIVLLDGDKRIFPEAVKYFSGDTVFGSDWGVESRYMSSLTMKGSRGGKYTVALLYAIDDDKEITKAEIYGQVIEFYTDAGYQGICEESDVVCSIDISRKLIFSPIYGVQMRGA
jgi:hypothetical protein